MPGLGMGPNALEPSFLPCEPDQPITEAASIIPECEAHELSRVPCSFSSKKKLFLELKQQIRLRRIAHVPMCVLLVNVAFRE
jgi:hypothetical protein